MEMEGVDSPAHSRHIGTIDVNHEYKEIITRQATKSSMALLKNGIVEINE
jgi:hypothetical protein